VKNTDAVFDQFRAAGHPLFNGRKLKLGTFCTNIEGGTIMSSIDGQATARWSSSLPIARVADELGFEAQVPVGRWRGVGGASDDGRPSMEVFTWAAAVGAVTSQSAVFATSHVSILHPIVAAKAAATVDDIAGGRFALNVVCGWLQDEMEMFGSPMLPHAERYECAAEWLTIVKRLWTEEDVFDHEGKYYKICGGYLQPKPPSKPRPPIMNAGTSETGRHFAAKHCDIAFIPPEKFDETAAQVKAYRDIARNEYGREIQLWSYAYIIQGDTEADARKFYDYYVHEKGDWHRAIARAKVGPKLESLSPEALKERAERYIAGGTGYPLIGTKDQIVDGLREISELGLDGVLLTWPRFLDGITQFKTDVAPLLQQTGLR
jgi:alkanesulfonate monooxygenase SsuD/methylene tetrahydromethanopterin reductase-like flavin-dependent oxidoreductase (luciferase family)